MIIFAVKLDHPSSVERDTLIMLTLRMMPKHLLIGDNLMLTSSTSRFIYMGLVGEK